MNSLRRKLSLPNIKSVKKDVIKSRKNHERNIAAKSSCKTFVKKARTAIDGHAENTAAAVSLAVKALDKTVERGIIHKNQAARRKSRLMKHQNKIAAGVAAAA